MKMLWMSICLCTNAFAGFVSSSSATSDQAMQQENTDTNFNAKIVEVASVPQAPAQQIEYDGFAVQHVGIVDNMFLRVDNYRNYAQTNSVIEKIAKFIAKVPHKDLVLTVYQKSVLPKSTQTSIQYVLQSIQSIIPQHTDQSLVLIPEYVMVDDTSDLSFWQPSDVAVIGLSYQRTNI